MFRALCGLTQGYSAHPEGTGEGPSEPAEPHTEPPVAGRHGSTELTMIGVIIPILSKDDRALGGLAPRHIH